MRRSRPSTAALASMSARRRIGFATAMPEHALDRGASLATVGDTLGHASIAVTSAYLHARPSDGSGLHLDEGVFRREVAR